ncbi:sodium/calcium exchanger 3 [Hyalella azteca]|uniref:Sodium/calcium exchanger 3 n=1 Tax=Hyalella azteca TaxID=294128 RepID=A0A979FID2_HYAAZ|nr:sodium/calcium exchanger 3 [Hyalella azteca]
MAVEFTQINGGRFINESALYSYRCSDKGLLLPFISEYTWPEEVRATLYFIGLLYCFLGVSIIADIFMGAIEKITSKTKKVRTLMYKKNICKIKFLFCISRPFCFAYVFCVYMAQPGAEEPAIVEVRVWSDTVANLTLMALGSSAPEIFLSCIEVVGNKFTAGELGPSNIVGSAAYNLFGITAICVMCVPKGETRRIKDFKVFVVTSVFSLVAYMWLLIIIVVISPNVVEVWEAFVTLSFFPLLVFLAWLAEKNFCGAPSKIGTSKQELRDLEPDDKLSEDEYFHNGHLDHDGLVRFIKEVKKYPGLTDEDIAALAASKLVQSQSHSRLWYRVGAVRKMTGGRKTQPQLSARLTKSVAQSSEQRRVPTLPVFVIPDNNNSGQEPCSTDDATQALGLGQLLSITSVLPASLAREIEQKARKDILRRKQIAVRQDVNAVIDFHAASCAIVENIGKFEVEVNRKGSMDHTVKVRVESIDGTAKEGQEYVGVNQVIMFEPGEVSKMVEVAIVDDKQWEPDEEFYLRLSLLPHREDREGVQLGKISIMKIVIHSDDEPGVLQFQRRGVLVKESCGTTLVPVVRKNGADGEVSVKWRTLDHTAFNKKDYIGGEGVLTFKHTVVELNIEIPIIDDMSENKDAHFEIELYDPEGGATLGPINRTAVTITSDDDFDTVISKIRNLTNANLHDFQVHHETYMSQIRDAFSVNGGDYENTTTLDYVLHFFTFGWKVIFALVPPPCFLGGWLCFFVSLAAIGVLSAIIGDLASIFGCLVGLHDAVTAIVFVALGTSLPDTFASKTAAVQEKHADNAIGNVTGSNSVNVFLGLGLPWLIAAVYHSVNKSTFYVESGNLGFSVGLFTILSAVCLGLIIARRTIPYFGKAELGGPAFPKYMTGFLMIALWLIYVFLASLQTYGYF